MHSGTSVIILGDGDGEQGSRGMAGFLAETRRRPPFSSSDTISICPPFSLHRPVLFKFLSSVPVYLLLLSPPLPTHRGQLG